MLYLVIFVIFCLYVTYSELKRNRYWKNKNVYSPFRTPFLGHLAPFFTNKKSFVENTQDLYKSHDGRYVGMFLFSEPVLLIKDLEVVKEIFIKNFDHFTDRHIEFSPKIDPLFANVLIFLKGNKWKVMRKHLAPAFNGIKMKEMVNKQIENGKTHTIDCRKVFGIFTIDALANCAFGLHCNTFQNENNEFYQNALSALNIKGFQTLKIFMYQAALNVMEFLSVRFIKKDVQEYFITQLMKNVASREKNYPERVDLINWFMETNKTIKLKNKIAEIESNDTKIDLTETELLAQTFLFLSAGFEGITLLSTFCAYELALNLEVQEKLYNEICETKKNLDGPITYEQLMEMKYLDMVIHESLRKWPVNVAQERLCTKPYTIKPKNENDQPLVLEAGSGVLISSYYFHRNPKYFKDPEKFDPERFNEENRKNIVQYSYLPFGVGPRNCIGSRFVYLDVKVLMYHLISEFEIVTVEKTPKEIKLARMDVLMESEEPIFLGLRQRNNVPVVN